MAPPKFTYVGEKLFSHLPAPKSKHEQFKMGSEVSDLKDLLKAKKGPDYMPGCTVSPTSGYESDAFGDYDVTDDFGYI